MALLERGKAEWEYAVPYGGVYGVGRPEGASFFSHPVKGGGATAGGGIRPLPGVKKTPARALPRWARARSVFRYGISTVQLAMY